MQNWNRSFTGEIRLDIHYFLNLIICIPVSGMLLLIWPEFYTDVLGGENLSSREIRRGIVASLTEALGAGYSIVPW
jgi:hypothetical protein